MKPGHLTFQAIAVLLAALLITPGCTSTSPIRVEGLQGLLSAPSTHKIYLQEQDGGVTRLDPNSEIRFILSAHEATPWIMGRDLWVSKAGLSFELDHGVHFLQWQEVAAAEVRNLSGGKTFGAMMLVVVVLGLLVVLIASKSGGSSSGGGIGGGKSRSSGAKHSWRRRSMGRASGVHLHLPLIIAAPHHAPRMDAPPPPASPPLASPPSASPPPASPPPAPGAPAPAPGGNQELKQAFDQVDGESTDQAPAEALKASPLFVGALRRSSVIQFMGAVAGGGISTSWRAPPSRCSPACAWGRCSTWPAGSGTSWRRSPRTTAPSPASWAWVAWVCTCPWTRRSASPSPCRWTSAADRTCSTTSS